MPLSTKEGGVATKKGILVKTQQLVAWQEVEDLVDTAVEQGIHHWVNSSVVICNRVDYSVELTTKGGTTHNVDVEGLTTGLQLLADKHPRRFRHVVEQDIDAEDADVFMQLCVFGDVVYG